MDGHPNLVRAPKHRLTMNAFNLNLHHSQLVGSGIGSVDETHEMPNLRTAHQLPSEAYHISIGYSIKRGID
jgi:D-arabinose 1-dehydrogenase-like Zn-dependent alcohol dehydrogenase